MESVRPTLPRPLSASLRGVFVLVPWLLAVGAGVWFFQRYAFSPSPSGQIGDWPSGSKLGYSRDTYTVVVALHPECPCSRATIDELERILVRGEPERVFVLMADYTTLDNRADRSTLWARTARLPGVTLLRDPDSAEARRFGAETSGDTRLYGPDGRLLFHGGVTASRGHAGPNPGSDAILELLATRASVLGASPPPRVRSTPVFGCAL